MMWFIRRLLHRGYGCPDCGVRPLKQHKRGCATAFWDGGTWA